MLLQKHVRDPVTKRAAATAVAAYVLRNYISYYIWTNITVLNLLRSARGFSTVDFRPHCGEAGNITNLGVGFRLAD